MIKEVPDRNFCWPDAFLSQICGKKFLRSEAPYRWFWGLHIENRIWKSEKKMLFSYKIRLSRCISGQITAKIWKTKISKMVFRKKGIKYRWGAPDRNFWWVEVFLSKFCGKKFSGSGTPKIDVFGAFFKNRYPKFLPVGKKRVFCVADFFEKSRKWRFILGGAPQKYFCKNWVI